ncbi:hypothetical protein HK102_007486, partial [Quaeritorhiza haematococci]
MSAGAVVVAPRAPRVDPPTSFVCTMPDNPALQNAAYSTDTHARRCSQGHGALLESPTSAPAASTAFPAGLASDPAAPRHPRPSVGPSIKKRVKVAIVDDNLINRMVLK